MEANVIFITSLKGGSGKSTVCADLAYSLSQKGKRVLVLSLDAYNMSMDMLFSCSGVFDISDHPHESAENICVPVDGCDSIALAVSAPFAERKADVQSFIREVKSGEKYDVILIDKAFDPGNDIEVAKMSDRVIVVSTQAEDSIRSAELLGTLLYDGGVSEEKTSLLLDSFYTDVASIQYFQGIDAIINETKLNLIGIIPYSDELCMKRTFLKNISDENAHFAFNNLAGRILGEDIKILDFLPTKNRRLILNNGCSGGNRI